MGLFQQTPSAVTRSGVFAIEVVPPRIIRGVSLGYVGLVAAFAWGPISGAAYKPDSGDDLIKTYEPAGSPRSSKGYYAIKNRLSTPWAIAGVKGVGAATATKSRTLTGGAMVATGKYAGALGNSITWQQKAASNGDATARDHVITLTGASGTTQEIYQNVALGGTVDTSKSRLLASLVFTGTPTAWGTDDTQSLASGSDGAALAATDYDAAMTLLDSEPFARVYCVDDCGDSIRPTVNSNLLNHVSSLTDRVAYIHGSPTNTWTQAKTDKAGYTSDRLCYFGTWVSILDDYGALQRSPLSTFAASARVQIGVHQTFAFRDPSVTKFYQGIQGIDASCPFNPQSETIQNESQPLGIINCIALPGTVPGTTAGFGPQHGRTCNLTSGLTQEVTRWYKDYLALNIVPALGPWTNGPNGPDDGADMKAIVATFMQEEARLKHVVPSKDKTTGQPLPPFTVDIESVNSQSTLDNGDFFIAVDAKTPGVRERTFLLLNVGETVTVRS